MGWKIILCVCVAWNCFGVNGQNEVRAYFNMSGVSGNIEFSEPTISRTNAVINIVVDRWFRWEIREFPVLTTDANNCDDETLGRRVHDLTTYLNVIDERTRLRSNIVLNSISLTSGDAAILGRSVLLHRNGGERACATIQGPETLSFSAVKGHIAGNVHVRQVGTRFAVFTDLFSTISLIDSQSRLKIYRGHVNADLPSATREKHTSAEERCENAHVSSRTMVAEIDNVPIAGGGSRRRFMTFITPNTIRFDFSSGWLRIGEDSDYSCANFHRFEPKTVQAVFSRDGVKGAITFKQDNPYKPTEVRVDLENLQSAAGGYHVHEFPLPYMYTTETDLCGVSSTGAHFNPFQSVTPNPILLSSTQELFEIGDLSSKHGSLNDLRNINETYMDLYLPLFGNNSIVGRSVVIHTPGGGRWICASIGYPGRVSVAKAEFNGDVEGTITFVQEEGMPWGDTTVFVQMTDSGSTRQSTLRHNYRIHTNPIGKDHLDRSGTCLSTGQNWNPFDARVSDLRVYREICRANRLGCEVGDLSGKYNEPIDIPASPAVAQYFYTDEIPLSGAYSVNNRSVTIQQPEEAAQRYVCTNIVGKLTPAVTTANRWYGAQRTDTVRGSVRMNSSGLASHITALNVDLEGLGRKAGGYHIHQFPLNTKDPGINVCDTTGGHYNPFGATAWEINDSQDRYEIGDISNKFEMLTNRNNYRLQRLDTNLPLGGPYSVVGRSVVIHDRANRWRCTNTIWDAQTMNGTLIQARAAFLGDIQGHVTLSQVISVQGESSVSIEVMLWHADGQKTSSLRHNWHVHVSSIEDNNCVSAGGHYNPFNKDPSSSRYNRECALATPRKCELGDMAGKLGKLDIGTRARPTRYVFNDDFLSLTGRFSVMGRSIVIHAENDGNPRVACADIAPFGPSAHVVQYYIRTPLGAFKNELADTISDMMNIDKNQNIYIRQGQRTGLCTTVGVYFTGENAGDLKRRFNALNLADDYRPLQADVCGSATGRASMVSGVLLLLTLLFTATTR